MLTRIKEPDLPPREIRVEGELIVRESSVPKTGRKALKESRPAAKRAARNKTNR